MKIYQLLMTSIFMLVLQITQAQLQLDVEGESMLRGKTTIDETGSLGNPFIMKTDNSASWMGIYNSNGYRGYLGIFSGVNDMDFGTGFTNPGGKTHLVTGAVPRLTVDGTGNVGIGIQTPLNKLHVEGDALFNSSIGNLKFGFPTSSGFGFSTTGGGATLILNSYTNTSTEAGFQGHFAFTNNGELGIGTTSPAAPLHLAGNGEQIRLDGPSPFLSFYDGSDYRGYLWHNGTIMYLFNRKNGPLYLGTNNLARMTVSGNGDVGIGTTTPTASLHVANPGGGTARIDNWLRLRGNTDGPAWALGVQGPGIFRGKLYAEVTSINTSTEGVIESKYLPPAGSNSDVRGVLGDSSVDDGWGYGVYGIGGWQGVRGQVNATGASSYYGIRGFATGGTGIKYSVYGSSGTGGTNYAGYFSGNLTVTGTFNNPSDAKLKQSVKSVGAEMLHKLNKLQAKEYEYKRTEFLEMNLPKGKQFGFIAQELQKEFPNLVKKNVHSIEHIAENGDKRLEKIEYLGVDYIGLIPVMTQAIQELSTENTELRTKNEVLAERLGKLEAAVEALSKK